MIFPLSEQLFEKLVSSQIARVNDTIISLTRDGVVIPPSITPIKQKPDDKEYGDRIIETSKRLEELDRLQGTVHGSNWLERYGFGYQTACPV